MTIKLRLLAGLLGCMAVAPAALAQSTVAIKDANGNPVSVAVRNPNGRAADANSAPVVLSTGDKATLDAHTAALGTLHTDMGVLSSGLTQMHTDLIAATPAGSAVIGKTGIDQTTPGTTNKISLGADVIIVSGAVAEGLAPANPGVVVDGVDPGGLKRVFLTDTLGRLQLAALPAFAAPPTVNLGTPSADNTAVGNLTAAGQTVTLTGLNGQASILVQLGGTFVGSAVVEYSKDSFATVKTGSYIAAGTGVTSSVTVPLTAPGFYRFLGIAGYSQARVRMSAYTSGTMATVLTTSAALDGGVVVSAIPQALQVTSNANDSTATPHPLLSDVAGALLPPVTASAGPAETVVAVAASTSTTLAAADPARIAEVIQCDGTAPVAVDFRGGTLTSIATAPFVLPQTTYQAYVPPVASTAAHTVWTATAQVCRMVSYARQ